MIKLTIKYEKEEEKQKIINALLKEIPITKISKPHKCSKYNKIYVDTELHI